MIRPGDLRVLMYNASVYSTDWKLLCYGPALLLVVAHSRREFGWWVLTHAGFGFAWQRDIGGRLFLEAEFEGEQR